MKLSKSSIANLVYELPQELLNDNSLAPRHFRRWGRGGALPTQEKKKKKKKRIRILGNKDILGKSQIWLDT